MIDPYNSSWEAWLQKWFTRLLLPAILINAGGLFIPIMEPDGALYAGIAKTIARTGDFINLRVEGNDWLDKPHFPFWMAAISFRIFGIHAFAYKLPAFIFWGAGAWYTYRLALSLYGKPIARLSALIYVSAAHLVISNNDVRAEPYLTGLVIGAVYHYYKASRANPGLRLSRIRPYWHLLAGSLLTACAIMTKGPFILVMVFAGFIPDGRLSFRSLVAALALIALFILPELYCLYVQFDLHPERTVFGRTGVSGIRFFFWDSQFGRFFNTGPIRGNGDPFFYFHTVLWAFLPWSLLLYAAIGQKCRQLAGGNALPGDRICTGAALSGFALFSLSRFQLPHYLNILFPFFAILTAGYLYGVWRRRTRKVIRILQAIIYILLPGMLFFLTWVFHFSGWPVLLVVLLLLSLLPFRLFRGAELPVSIVRSFYAALLAFAFLNFFFYPAILRYQAGTAAGRYIESRRLPVSQEAFTLTEAYPSYAFEFYCPLPVRRVPVDSLALWVKAGPRLVFAPSSFADTLRKKGYQIGILHQFPHFHVSQLSAKFLDHRTRASVLEWYSIMWVNYAGSLAYSPVATESIDPSCSSALGP